MPFARRLATALAAPALILSLSSCGINSIPTAEENAKARWGDVEAEYQRRADLIPNLVKTVEAAAIQERTTLREVTEARAKATSVQLNAEDLTDPAKVEAFEAAQNQLSGALGRLLVVTENYPNLKANDNFIALQKELAGTENQINVARRDYNGAVQAYNTEIRTFPSVIGANIIYGAKPMTPFKAAPGSDKAPTVDFGGIAK
ncbi:LemA protein [Sphingomonas zeicaulis]|uniref:LemA family protein n=1 Tax=Sphingomonas zeicaulis TaxID=1632740 RepID=UPI003D1D758A